MKKHIVISLLIGIICCTAIYTFGSTGIVKTDDLRLREEGSSSSEIITLLSEGEKVEIISKTEDGWYKVKYKDYEGYVSADFINVEDGVITDSSAKETKTSTEEKNIEQTEQTETPKTVENNEQEENASEETNSSTKKIISKDQKIYGVPLINASTIKIVEQDTIVDLLAEINGWSYIRSDSLEGWIRTDKLKDEKSETTTTTVNAQKEVLFLPTLPTFTFNSLTTNALGYVGNYVGM